MVYGNLVKVIKIDILERSLDHFIELTDIKKDILSDTN